MRAAQEDARSLDPRQNGRSDYESEEPKGIPHGFFYSFDYPVNLIIPRGEQRSLKGAASSIEAVTVKPDSRTAQVAVDAVHDAQVHPKQKVQ